MNKICTTDNNTPLMGTINQDAWTPGDFATKLRLTQAVQSGISKFPIYRELRFAARVELDQLFDDLALNMNCSAQRLDSHTLILESNNALVSARAGRATDYCSCAFSIWADSPENAEAVRKTILNRVGDTRIEDPMFSIDWHFLTSKGELENARIEELANDVLYDESYPELEKGVANFIAAYLAADESVLVLQGPPGTGKTRLVRAVLGEISRQKGGKASALYTGDKKALESDEIFVRFITGWEDAFVAEDADHLLKPRAEGNENLHRFLSIADGVVRAQGRKIIFSTNLPNVGDLDDALIRPGRCFARLMLRRLSTQEAEALLGTLCASDDAMRNTAHKLLMKSNEKLHSLAEVYKATANAEQHD